MNPLTSKEKKALVENMRKHRDRIFPGRGGVRHLAEAVGVSPQLLSQWMRGKRVPPPARLYAIAKVFGIGVRELCGRRTAAVKFDTPAGFSEVVKGEIAAIDALILVLRHSKQALLGKTDAKRHKQAMRIINTMLEKELNDK